MTDVQFIATFFLKLWWIYIAVGIGYFYARHITKDMEDLEE